MSAFNCYEDARRADAYSKLKFPGTYYLAYRDLPRILEEHIPGRRALDFGCGAGRSTRFLREHGFAAVGVDISADMIAKAKAEDPEGDYRLIGEEGFREFDRGNFDVVLSAFTFDNIPARGTKVRIFRELGELLAPEGKIVNLVSSPEIYLHEWASFSTRDFPENAQARSGDRVKIIITEIEDSRPVEDIVWSDESYQEVYREAGLEVVETTRPLGKEDEPYPWVNETRIAPWVIYVLRRMPASGAVPGPR